ncbi:MAG: hypothetical protein ACK46L_03730, partial [Synechococcaceae cyanobacterium]
YDHISKPFMSVLPGIYDEGETENAASWQVTIKKGKPFYRVGYEEIGFNKKENIHYAYHIYDWPFVLFEVIYEALDIAFERTSINLSLCVEIRDDSGVLRYPYVKHSELSYLLSQQGD